MTDQALTETAVYDGLNTIFHDLFDDDSIQVSAGTTAADVAGWDSFQHLNIIVSVEARFGIKFSTTEIESLKTVGDIVKLIRAKRA